VVAFPPLMARRPDPLVPLEIFRSRAFSTINLSTFVIYGALYMNLAFQQLFLQGVLRYSPLSAALGMLPGSLLLMLLSTRFGRLAGRHGPRLFLTVGPALMAAAVLYFARLPSTSTPWQASPSTTSSTCCRGSSCSGSAWRSSSRRCRRRSWARSRRVGQGWRQRSTTPCRGRARPSLERCCSLR
jgi:hypothetical protein